MITNFEEITKELTTDEKKCLPLLIKGFMLRTKDNPVKTPEIIEGVNRASVVKFNKKILTGARLRKMCNFIRSRGILPLIGSSHGYYVSYDPHEITLQVQSLTERAEAIMAAANGLKKQIKSIEYSQEN